MTLTGDQLQFLARFSRSPDWLQLSKILEGMEAEVMDRLLSVTGEQVHQALGEVRFIRRLRKDIATAAQALDRADALRRQSAAARSIGSHAA